MASIMVQIFDGVNQIQYQGLATDGMLVFSHQGRHDEKVPRDQLLLRIKGLTLHLPHFCDLVSDTDSFRGTLVNGDYIFRTAMSTWDMITTPIKLSLNLGRQQIDLDLVGGDTRPTSPIEVPADLADRELTMSIQHADGGYSTFCGIVAPSGHAIMGQKSFSVTEHVPGKDRFNFSLREGQHIMPLKPAFSVRLNYGDVWASASAGGFFSQPRPSAAVLLWTGLGKNTTRTYFLHFSSAKSSYWPFETLPPFSQAFGIATSEE